VASSDRRRQPNQREEAGRYRKAADLAIENLDWCINYLHQIRKHKIANSLHRNRMTIVKRYRDD
jgi:hypothetical protein